MLYIPILFYRYRKELEKGLSVPTMMYTYSPGGSILNHTLIWRLPDDFSVEATVSINQQVVCKLNERLPVFHTGAMKKEFVTHYGLFMPGVKPYLLRSIYRELTTVVRVGLVQLRKKTSMSAERKPSHLKI